MTIGEILFHLGADVANSGDGEREVTRGIVGDLLSHVMGTAPENALWITIHGHLNVAAVAVLRDIPCVILAGGRTPSPDFLERCRAEGIAVGLVKDAAFDVCGKLWEIGLRG